MGIKMMESFNIDSDIPFWRKKRYLVVLMVFLGYFNVYTLRVNLSVAIVAMTETHNVTLVNGTVVEQQNFDWDSKKQGVLLSAFFYGYICTQLLGGVIANKLGGNIVFGFGVGATAVLTLLTPWAANISFYLVVAVRIVEGVFEGVTYPCIYAIWSKWAPNNEKSRMVSIAHSGTFFGLVIGMPLSGIFASNFGWESVFYGFGTVGCVWCLAWFILVKENPEKDPRCSPAERQHIKKSLGPDAWSTEGIKHPWREIFRSKPVWALAVAQFTDNWGFYTLLTQLPIYLRDTLHFDIEKSGFLSALPYITMCIVLWAAGYTADWLLIKGYLSTTKLRKCFNSVSFGFQAIFMILAANFPNPIWSLVCLILGTGLGAISYNGFGYNHLDIAPMHASVLMGISNTFGTIPGIVSPLLSGFIVQNKSIDEWKIIFYLTATIYIVGGLIFYCWCSGEKQSWATTEEVEETKSLKGPRDRTKITVF